jgi:hypothetical protein
VSRQRSRFPPTPHSPKLPQLSPLNFASHPPLCSLPVCCSIYTESSLSYSEGPLPSSFSSPCCAISSFGLSSSSTRANTQPNRTPFTTPYLNLVRSNQPVPWLQKVLGKRPSNLPYLHYFFRFTNHLYSPSSSHHPSPLVAAVVRLKPSSNAPRSATLPIYQPSRLAQLCDPDCRNTGTAIIAHHTLPLLQFTPGLKLPSLSYSLVHGLADTACQQNPHPAGPRPVPQSPIYNLYSTARSQYLILSFHCRCIHNVSRSRPR